MTEANNNEELSLIQLISKLTEWIKYLFTKAKIIILAGIIGASIGVFYAYLQKPKYLARLSFVLENDQGSSGYSGIASQFGLDLGGSASVGAFSGDNILELMKSRSLVEKALLTPVDISGRKTLVEHYIEFNNYREQWEKKDKLRGLLFPVESDRSGFTLEQDSVLGVFYNQILNNNLVVDKQDKKSSIMFVNVNSENELFSKFFAEILVDVVSNFYIEAKTKKSSANLKILQNQTDSVRRVLNAAIGGVAISVDSNPNINPARQILLAPSQRRTIDVQANQIMFTELVKNLELSKMSLLKETPLVQIIDKPILPLVETKVSKKISMIVGGVIGALLLALFLIGHRLITNLNDQLIIK